MRITLEANGKTMACELDESLGVDLSLEAAVTWLELAIRVSYGQDMAEVAQGLVDQIKGTQHTHGFGDTEILVEEGVDVDARAKIIYNRESANHPIIHANRFMPEEELTEEQKDHYRRKVR